MLRNYLNTALRNIRKRKMSSAVLIFGLTISIGFCLLMFLYVDGALNWDKMHPEAEETYFIGSDNFQADDVEVDFSLFDFSEKPIYRSATLPYAHTRDFQENIPELANSLVVYGFGRPVNSVKVGEENFSASLISADDNFFDFFAYETIRGNPVAAHQDARSVVISEEMAMRLFGSVDVVNQLLSVMVGEETEPYQVGAVVKMPVKSSVQIGVLLNFEGTKHISDSQYNVSGNRSFYLFFKKPQDVEIASLEAKLSDYFVNKYLDYIHGFRSFVNLREDSPVIELRTFSLTSIHLNPLLNWTGKANVQHILLVAVFAIVLLIVSTINYFLITIATLGSRTKEVSIRRITGAGKREILIQFWLENSFNVIVSLFLAICSLQIVLPFIEEFTGEQLIVSLPLMLKGAAVIGVLLLLANLIISLYPSVLVIGLGLSDALKGKKTLKAKTGFVNGLVGVQFFICFVFITLGLVMNNQLKFVLEKDLGFDKDQVVSINSRDATFAEEIKSYPEFEKVGRGGGFYFGHLSMSFVQPINGEKRSIVTLFSDKDLIDLFGVNVDWVVDPETIDKPAIISGELADVFGRDNLIGQKVGFGQTVAGVLDQVYLFSLKGDSDPYYMIDLSPQEFRLRQVFVKLQAGSTQAGLNKLEEIWNEFYPDKQFNYQFTDEYINENYDSYATTRNLINLITFLGVVIACLGVFALNGIISSNRMKEIGIRKVLGAGVKEIVLLVNRPMILLLLVASVISIPVSYQFASDWLENFAVQIDLGFNIYFFTVLIGLVISVLTVSGYTLKSVNVNPSELLKED